MLTFLGKLLKIVHRRKSEMRNYILSKGMQEEKENSKVKTNKMIAINEMVEYPNKLVLTGNANGRKYYSKRQKCQDN